MAAIEQSGFAASSLHLSADQVSMLIPALGLLMIAVVIARSRPRIAAAVWLAVICFVPCWVCLDVKYSFPAAVAMSMLLVVALFPTVPRDLSIGDWMMLGLFVAGLAPALIHASDKSATLVLVTYWCSAYLLGRIISLHTGLDWLYRAVAIAFTVVAAAALLEFAFSWNPFVMIHANNGLYTTWSPLQQRGDVLRAEGAFGHSIALGVSVAMAIPLVLASHLKLRTRILMVLVMLGCEAVTFSRAGMICAGLGIALLVVFGRDEMSTRTRAAVITALIAVALIATPTVSSAFESASTEASASAGYRLSLTSLIPHISLIGRSPEMYTSASGDKYVGTFRSIDSALILFGLTYGAVALILACCMLLGGIYLLITRQATAPTIAVVAQIPALMSVALITQYQVVFWFVVGLAICTQAAQRMVPSRIDAQVQLSAVARPTVHTGSHLNVVRGERVAIGGND